MCPKLPDPTDKDSQQNEEVEDDTWMHGRLNAEFIDDRRRISRKVGLDGELQPPSDDWDRF